MKIKEYKKYLKDNPKGYWFKAKWYGWGWVPVTRQGWIVVAAFILILVLNGMYLESKIPDGGDPFVFDLAIYVGVVLASILGLLWICYKKGETPHWSWGDPKKRKQK